MPNKLKVALMINMIAPSRLAIFAGLADQFDLMILQGGSESNRDTWRNLEDSLPGATLKRAWGWQFQIPRKVDGVTIDHQHIHIRPGLLWELVRFHPDVIITNEMGFRTLTALLYSTFARTPVWVWWGGTMHTERNIGFLRKSLRFLIVRLASRWLSYGKTSTEYLTSLGIDDRHIVEIQNSVDEQRFLTAPAMPEFEIQPRPVFLCVGQLIARKGVGLLLHAAARLQKEGEVFSLLLVGSGPDKAVLQQSVAELGLQHVFFKPSCTPDKMAAVYQSADVLIFPTLEDVWGLVANEAILCGLPVLCSKFAGCAAELFSPQSVFDPENEDEFVDKLRRAVHGDIPKPVASRLVTTPTNLARLVTAIRTSTGRQDMTLDGIEV